MSLDPEILNWRFTYGGEEPEIASREDFEWFRLNKETRCTTPGCSQGNDINDERLCQIHDIVEIGYTSPYDGGDGLLDVRCFETYWDELLTKDHVVNRKHKIQYILDFAKRLLMNYYATGQKVRIVESASGQEYIYFDARVEIHLAIALFKIIATSEDARKLYQIMPDDVRELYRALKNNERVLEYVGILTV